MRNARINPGRIAVMITVPALLATAFGGAVVAQDEAEPVQVCELAYYTGGFASYGPSLTNDVRFVIDEVINTDPPLERPWELISEDIGDSMEGQAAKRCIEKHGAEIIVSIAHQYRNYRDYMIEQWAENDAPLAPTIHGGAIPGNLGGNVGEPLFRAQGVDDMLGVSGALYADSIGAENVVIFATEVEGFQLAANAAEKATAALGLNLLARFAAPAEQASYRADAQKIFDLDPDAVLVQAGSVESANLIKSAAEAGLALNWIGETGWSEAEFISSLGTDPIPTQEAIGFAAFAPNFDSPGWQFYEELWNTQEGCTEGVAECPPYDATTPYAFSGYDLLVHTALAIEQAGSYNVSDWVPAMYAVGDESGEACYLYADCLALLREGKAINYDGATGPATYTETGVNAVTPSYQPFNDDGTKGDIVHLDADKGLEILNQAKSEAVCDEDNICEW
jgi:branched-chain amino acid transport system substrate-binding protein